MKEGQEGQTELNKKVQSTKLMVLLMFKKFTGYIESMLESKNFMQLRNIVVVLSRMIEIYPETKSNATRIIAAFKKNFDEKDIGTGNSLDYQAKSYRIALTNNRNGLPFVDLKSIKSKLIFFRIERKS